MAKLLIVEDDKELNSLVCSFFEQNNYNVKSASNGIEALQLFNEEDFDLIISDIMMPLMDGFSLLEKIRTKNKNIPFSCL